MLSTTRLLTAPASPVCCPCLLPLPGVQHQLLLSPPATALPCLLLPVAGLVFSTNSYSARLLSQVAYNPLVVLPRALVGADVEPMFVPAGHYARCVCLCVWGGAW